VAVGSSLDGFYYDPKAGRAERLRKTLRLIADQIERCMACVLLGRGRSPYRALFVTLTYKANTKGKPRDVVECLKCVRSWLARQGLPMCPYLWVAELQKRGALHYHLMVWLRRGLHLPKLDRCGWWRHGMTKVETARNPIGYLVKYASKFNPGDVARFRKGTRLYGYGGLFPEVREGVRRARMARWMRHRVDEKLEAEFMAGVEFEIAQQEHEEAAMLHAFFPDDHPDPGEFETEQEADERMVEDWDAQGVMQRLRRRGWARFTRCVGGFVDKLTGEFSSTPWAAAFTGGVLHVWPKEAMA
jgi:hypothetical protein